MRSDRVRGHADERAALRRHPDQIDRAQAADQAAEQALRRGLAERVQRRNPVDAPLTPKETDVVCRVQLAPVIGALASRDEEAVLATECRPLRFLRDRPSARRAAEDVEVEEAARAVSPPMRPPPATLPRRAVADVDTGDRAADGVVVRPYGERSRRQPWEIYRCARQ